MQTVLTSVCVKCEKYNMEQPKLWKTTLGSGAEYNEIPDTNDVTKGYASVLNLFPEINGKPLSKGGIPPRRKDFNGLFKMVGDHLYYLQNGGQYQWANTQNYGADAIIMHNKVLYQALLASGPDSEAGPVEPGLNEEFWKELIPIEDIADAKEIADNALETATAAKTTIDQHLEDLSESIKTEGSIDPETLKENVTYYYVTNNETGETEIISSEDIVE